MLRNRLCRVVSGLVALALPVLFSLVSFSQTSTAPARIKITPGKDTTWFTDPPMREDGTVDYVKAFSALLRQGITPENNGFAPILKVLGPDAVSDNTRKAMLAELDIKDLPMGGGYYQPLDSYLAATGVVGDAQDKIDEDARAFIGLSWKAGDHRELAGWLKHEEKNLDAIAAGVKLGHFNIPAISPGGTMISVLLPSLGELRDVERGLAIRVSLRVGEGNLDAAMQDSLASHRLARLLTQQGFLIQRLVGYSNEMSSVTADRAILSSPKLTSAQSRYFLAELQKLPPLGSVADAIDCSERLEMLDVVMVVARGNGAAAMAGLPGPSLALTPQEAAAIDWDALLRKLNARYDAMVAAARMPTFAQRTEAWKKVDAELQAVQASAQDSKDLLLSDPRSIFNSKRIELVLIATFVPSLSRASVLNDRIAMLADEDEVAFALAAYRAEKGSYPEILAALVPGYIKAIPADRFTGNSLVYKPEADGFLLYSVSDDLVDNGGAESGDTRHRDLVVRVTRNEAVKN